VARRRFGKNQDDSYRFARGVYYNTTGIEIAGTVRQRQSRATRASRRVEDSILTILHGQSDAYLSVPTPGVWKGDNKVLFQRVLPAPEKPDRFLVVVTSKLNGALSVGTNNWRSGDTSLIAFSESADEQEAMLLMPASGWIRTSLGHFVLEPEVRRRWIARLVLVSPHQE
jgi:hypothetical protein